MRSGALRTRSGAKMPEDGQDTPLKNKIEQLLTEARVIIPGGQALLGFQFIVVFTKSSPSFPRRRKASMPSRSAWSRYRSSCC